MVWTWVQKSLRQGQAQKKCNSSACGLSERQQKSETCRSIELKKCILTYHFLILSLYTR